MGACLVAALGGLLFGFDTAVINGAIERVKEQYALSDGLAGWVVASALVGCLIGAAIAGALADRFGRKKVLLLAAVLFTISAIGAALPQGATAITQLVLARIIGGMGIGIASMLSPMYIAEISPARLRGGLIATYQLAITIGIVGVFFSNYGLFKASVHHPDMFAQQFWRWIFAEEVWRAMFLVGVIPAAILFLSVLLVPESPRWLTKQGRVDEAMGVLTRVNGRSEAARALAEIKETLALETGTLGQLFQPGMRLALLIGIVLPFLSQVSGINVIIYFGETVLTAAGYKEDAALKSQIIFGSVNVLSTVVAILMVDKLGRKPLLLLGIAGVGAMLAIAGYLFRQETIPGTQLLYVFAFYLACFAISYGPVCWIIIAEIFPTSIRGRAMSIATFSLWSGCTLVAQTFLSLKSAVGPGWCFWLYAMTTPLAFAFVWYLVPETKGKTLEQIEKHWGH
jgi:SP family arabinose:H+ symporter-like MFS transporter